MAVQVVDPRCCSRPQGGGVGRGGDECLIIKVYVPIISLKPEASTSRRFWPKSFGEGIMGLNLLDQVGLFPLDRKGPGLCPIRYFCVSLESSRVTGTVRINTQ